MRHILLAGVILGLLAVPERSFALNGDVNLDGAVSQADVDVLGNYLVSNSSFLPSSFNADVNQDAQTDSADALILQQFVNGLRPFLPTAISSTTIAGTMSGTLADASVVYVATGSLIVPPGQTLTLGPGVVIKMGTGTQFTVNGILISQGSAAAPVIITSLNDDSSRGDTNGNGPSQGSEGDWGALIFNNSTAATRLAHATLRFGQRVVLTAASPHFQNVTISSMSQVAVLADLASFPTGSGVIAFGSPINGIDLPGGQVLANGTWSHIGLPYVIRGGQVGTHGVVTIAPGAVFKFQGADSSLGVVNTLRAIGTSTTPITFTSLKDDSVGGDTNGDGSLTQPAAGDWESIIFQTAGSSGSVLERCRIRYGGRPPRDNGQASVLVQFDSTAAIRLCEIRDSGTSGIWVRSGGAPLLEGNTVQFNGQFGVRAHDTGAGATSVLGNVVLNNGNYGVGLTGQARPAIGNILRGNAGGFVFTETGAPMLTGNVVENNSGSAVLIAGPNVYVSDGGGNSVSGNALNGIELGASLWTQSGTFGFTALSYVIRAGRVDLGAGDTSAQIRLVPGAVFKLLQAGSLGFNNTITAVGTSTAPITFTSLKDDSVGGDTNADGNASSPAPGDWQYIVIHGNASSGSRLEHSQIRYGGSDGQTSLYLQFGTTLTIRHTDVRSSSTSGILVRNDAAPQISSSTIRSNGRYGIESMAASRPVIRHSIIQGNAGEGVVNRDSGILLDATQNYWGSATGPTHAANPGGAGDTVSGNVNYTPFLTEAPF
jgi:hypothetical protein